MSDEKTHADIIAEMRRDGIVHNSIPTKYLNAYADRLEAAHKREAGDAAKLRGVLETLRELLGDLLRLGDAEYHDDFSNFCDIIDAALAAPPRNCDVGSAEEQVKRFTIFCKSQRLHSPGHADFCDPKCPCRDGGDINLCALTWAQMPYEEGGAE